MNKELVAVRKRLRDSFPFYAQHALKIRTKEGAIQPLILNEGQRKLHEVIDRDMKTRGYARVVVLKGRQTGISTMIAGYFFFAVSQRKASKAMVLAHAADSTKSLFDMTKRLYDNCPEILKPSTKYASRRELSFDKLDSSYTVSTAGGESVGRGETLTHLHASEVAFWPKSTASDIWAGLMQAVPNSPGSAIIVESTACGVSGTFYELWNGAVAGTNGFSPCWIPWFGMPEYRLPVTEPLEYTPDEEKLRELYKLDDEQLQFRRTRIAMTSLEAFWQEYPCCPEEAFLTSGMPVFSPMQLNDMLSVAPEPEVRLALEGDEWLPHPRGELLVYHPHAPGESYVIGADIAMGGGRKDYSVAQVLDSKKRQVAVYRSNSPDPDYFATLLEKMGYYYNEALLVPESNAHGILTCARLGKDFAYPRLWMVTEVNKTTDRESTSIGFRTDAKTKPMIIDQLRASLREGEIELNCKTTLKEMMSFIVTDSGALEAEKGCHDDTVMALAIANYAHEGRFEPVKVTDDFYVEAI